MTASSRKHFACFHPTDINVPNIKISFYNIRSLSAYRTDRAGYKRYSKVIQNITDLLTSSHILCLQETHLLINDDFSLRKEFKDYKFFYNNLGGAGGLLTLIHSSVCKFYDISEIPLASVTKGRVQALRFDSAAASDRYDLPFNLINWHFEGAKVAQVRSLLKIDNSVRNIGGGDCNFVVSPDDAPSENSGIILAGALEKAWDSVVEHLSFVEVHQPTPTHYFVPLNMEGSNARTSRIDRVYISMDSADKDIFKPLAFIPKVRHNILHAFNSKLDDNLLKVFFNSWVSDHLPISIHLFKTKKPHFPRRQAPRWLAKDENFIGRVRSHLKVYDEFSDNPFTAYDDFRKVVETETKNYFSEKKEGDVKVHADLNSLHVCLKALRLTSLAIPNIPKLLSLTASFPFLKDLVGDLDSLPIADLKLRSHTNALLLNDFCIAPSPDTDFDAFVEHFINNPPSSSKASSGKSGTPSFCEEVRASGALKNGSHLTALRSDPLSPPTSVPKRVAAILGDFWQNLGNVRQDAPPGFRLDEYLAEYDVVIPPDLSPSLPSLDDIIDCINGSNNSCPGPDGVHFAFIRPFVNELAPIIESIIIHLANGFPPPLGFNHVLQFFIPKGDSLLAKDTRPISVANSIARVIAKLMVDSLLPAAKKILSSSQKGFVPGRQSQDHIFDLTTEYYAKLEKKQQHYLLLLDTEKAFDSLDHNFIFKVLTKINCPGWFINAYRGLLDNIEGIPVVNGPTAVRIHLKRGVKQGCPLSPIIFALCFDVLLFKLGKFQGKGHKDYAYADDLAISTGDFHTVIGCLHIIKSFSRYSGLGINYKKSVILPTTRVFYEYILTRNEHGFGDIEFVSKSKYLGVLIGRTITTLDIFAVALDKFFDRLGRLRGLLKNSNLGIRTRICNTYLLPIFYYLMQFYILPYSYCLRVKEALRRAIIPFGGGGFGYAHLVAPKNIGGPYSPLTDIWAINYALLGQHFDFNPSHGSPVPIIDNFEWWNETDAEEHAERATLLISEHWSYAAFVYLRDNNTRDLQKNIDVSHLTGPPGKIRRKLYRDLVSEGWWMPRESILHKTSTHRKLLKITPTPLVVTIPHKPHLNIIANVNRCAKNLSSTLWDFRIRLIMRALPTDTRLLEAGLIISDKPCYLCGLGPDDVKHLYFDCPATALALTAISGMFGVCISPTPLHLLLISPPPPIFLSTMIISTFVWAVWNQRTYYFKGFSGTPLISTVANRVADFVSSLMSERGGGKWRGTVLEFSKIKAIAAKPPTGLAVIGFSDGSALGNPGPVGTGVWFSSPPPPTPSSTHPYFPNSLSSIISPPLAPPPLPLECSLSVALGQGDNNWGEMMGIMILLKLVESFFQENLGVFPADTPVFLFSDSLSCICYLTDGWSCPTEISLARATRKLYISLVAIHSKLRIYWVKGHSGIPDNERVDKLAGMGSKFSQSSGNVRPVLVSPALTSLNSVARNAISDVLCGGWVQP